MKSMLRRDFLREIAHTRSRFLSILVLIALSVAFLSGLRSTAPDMKRTGDDYLDAQHLADIQVLSNLGLTEGDVEALLAQSGIENAEGAYVLDAFAASETANIVVKLWSLTRRDIDNVLLRSGRLPETDEECVVDELLLARLDLRVGDTLTLTPPESLPDALRHERFVITGAVRSPAYISTERGSSTLGTGSVQAYLYLPPEAFELEYYTTALLRVRGAAEMTAFYEDYDDRIEDEIDALEPLAEERAQARYDELVGDATEKLDDAQRELDEAKADAEEELSKAEQELADARRELDDGWAELEDAEQRLTRETDSARREIADGRAELASALTELSDGEAEYEDGLAEYERGREAYEEGLAQYESGYETYAANRADYEEGFAAYEAGLAQYEEGRAQYEAGLAQYETGKEQYEAGLAELAQTLRGLGLLTGEELPDPAALAENPMIGASPELGAAVAQLAAAKAELDASLPVLEATKAQLDGAEAELAGSKAELDAGGAELDAAEEELNAAKAELDDAKAELDAGKTELDEARSTLDDGWREYEEGLDKIEDAERTLAREIASARREIEDGRAELESGEQEYADGLAEYEDGKREAEEKIADAEAELRDARKKVAEIERGEWYIFSRAYNPGYTGFGQDADRMGSLASVFPMIFFLVAALVCLTTMTRMVEEQRVQIGSLKALGYSRFAISLKYIGYGLLPSLIGSVLGLAVGYTLFPKMIFTAWQIMYQVPDIELRTYPGISLFSTAFAVACTTVSTLWACLATLRETPASLMRPRSPKAGKRVFLEYIRPLWRRMKFIHKVTARNLFRYQKRFWMTVIGIGGCTALIIAGFGLRYSLTHTMERQYGELFHYTAQLALSDSATAGDRAKAEALLNSDSRIQRVTPCDVFSANAVSSRYSITAYVETMEAEKLAEAVLLPDAQTRETLTMGDEGVYIDQKLSELLGVTTGDSFLIDGDERATVRVAGVFEHYTGHFIYMTPAYYEKAFGIPPETNAYLLTLESDDPALCDELFEEFLSLPGAAAAARMADTRETYMNSMERVDFVVVIVILAAAALAVVVLYNLSNINITERMRELATIKLLGFYDGEVSAYVYRENIVLTVFGIAAGILMGHWLHVWLVHSTEIDMMMFGRETNPRSYVYAAVLTALFSFLVNLMSHFKMKRIDMVESLKSAE